jgi:hypothetical protein
VNDDPGVHGIANLVVSPNPSRNVVRIAFDLGTSERVQIRIVDAEGKTAAVLCNQMLTAGAQRFEWDANVPDGTYFYELLAGTPSGTQERRTGKIVIAM